MAEKHRKRPRDPNQLAKFIVDLATSERAPTEAIEAETEENPATLFARRGGWKGGKARAAKLSAKRRSEIARVAAQTRWKPKGDK